MGFSCYTISTPLKSLRNLIIMRPTLAHAPSNFGDDQFQPLPSLVLLPIHFMNKSINKDRLPIVAYATLTQAHEEGVDEDEDEDEDEADDQCAICLSEIEALHNVRELGNCKHGFHVECLDSWIDHGRTTCPVCRSELVSGHGKDPWRSERMVYLFGEDCSMDELIFGNF